jgi:hypothetical protein
MLKIRLKREARQDKETFFVDLQSAWDKHMIWLLSEAIKRGALEGVEAALNHAFKKAMERENANERMFANEWKKYFPGAGAIQQKYEDVYKPLATIDGKKNMLLVKASSDNADAVIRFTKVTVNMS